MKFTLQFLATLILIVIASLTSLLLAYVIHQISIIYSLNFISEMSLSQVFGMTLIFGLLKHKIKTEEKDQDQSFSEILAEGFKACFSSLFMILFFWGISIVIFYIIF